MAGSIDNPGSLNRYVYVGDDPVNYVDPDGEKRRRRFTKCMAMAGAAAVVAGLGAAVFASPTGPGALVTGLGWPNHLSR